MQNKNSIHSYLYYTLPGQDYLFGFVTEQKIRYEVRFRLIETLFSDIPELTRSTFEISIIPVFSPNKTKQQQDKRISATIAEIIEDFFFHLPENVTIYLYDASDERHESRKRLFDSWSVNFKEDDVFTKVDVALNRNKPEDVAFSVIFRCNNPYKDQILASLEELKNDYEQDK